MSQVLTAGDEGKASWRARWPLLSGLVTVVLVAAAVVIVLVAVPR
jgi:hypothetical protein